ncbi:MAG: hypothetical protein MI919_30620 [Holophagales bacterium]|nr:hypothetical protein [Holophagales bacterium]
MWWHRAPMQELLELDGAQVKVLDELCREHLLRRWQLRAWQRQEAESGAGVDVHQALEALEIEAARRALEARAELLGWLATADGRLEVEVLGVLRGDQLETLARERPVLLRRPWLKQVGRGSLDARRVSEGAGPPG